MIKLKDLLDTLQGPDKIRIFKDGRCLYTGYQGALSYHWGKLELTGEEKVVKFHANLEIRHRYWKDLGLERPLEPDETPRYLTKDLQMELYHIIVLSSPSGQL